MQADGDGLQCRKSTASMLKDVYPKCLLSWAISPNPNNDINSEDFWTVSSKLTQQGYSTDDSTVGERPSTKGQKQMNTLGDRSMLSSTHADHGQLRVIYSTNYEMSCGRSITYRVKGAQQLPKQWL